MARRHAAAALSRTAALAAGLAVRGRGGKALDFDLVARRFGVRFVFRKFYGAFVDAHGLSYADVDQTIGRIRSFKPDAWLEAWLETAQRYDGLGRRAVAEGRHQTALQMLLAASTCYRLAEMGLLDDSVVREQVQRASIDAVVLAGHFMDPPLERVPIPVDDHETTAYTRVPRTGKPPPVVVVVPGLGMVKEHGDYPPEMLLKRGVATLVVDLPGQGENRGAFSLGEENARRIISGAIDYLQTRSDVDFSRLGLLGTSLGAAAAMVTASVDRRVKALAEIAGFYYPLGWWRRFPNEIKEFLRYVMGAADQAELLELVRPINLRGHVARIECPLLVVHGMKDAIIPFSESDLIYQEAAGPKERMSFREGDHGCVNVTEARPRIADWILDRLNGVP
ncbi:MAG: alpha/beta hydrolase, partial [Chloroflexota bacterium]